MNKNEESFRIMNAVMTVRDIRDRSAKLVDALDDILDFTDLQLIGKQEKVMREVISNIKSIVNYTALREEYDTKRILDICEEDEDREKWLDGKINDAIERMDKIIFTDKVFGDVPEALRCDDTTCNIE